MDPQTMTVDVGGTVTFTWSAYHNVYQSAYHDVYQSANEADYDACVKTGGTMRADATNTNSYQHTFTAPGTFYFICSVGGHCRDGQKIAVTVTAATTPSNSPPAVPPLPGSGGQTRGPPAPFPGMDQENLQIGGSGGVTTGVGVAVPLILIAAGAAGVCYWRKRKRALPPPTTPATTSTKAEAGRPSMLRKSTYKRFDEDGTPSQLVELEMGESGGMAPPPPPPPQGPPPAM